MAMAAARHDVISILKKAEVALVDWDGHGVPPDGGLYKEKTDGDRFWFVCLMCDDSVADPPHCCSEGHTGALQLLLERTARQVRATCSAAAPLAAVRGGPYLRSRFIEFT